MKNYYFYLGCITARGVGWESYGYDRCSVLVITGIFKFQFYIYEGMVKYMRARKLDEEQDKHSSQTIWTVDMP
jgi:hypothetical protein